MSFQLLNGLNPPPFQCLVNISMCCISRHYKAEEHLHREHGSAMLNGAVESVM